MALFTRNTVIVGDIACIKAHNGTSPPQLGLAFKWKNLFFHIFGFQGLKNTILKQSWPFLWFNCVLRRSELISQKVPISGNFLFWPFCLLFYLAKQNSTPAQQLPFSAFSRNRPEYPELQYMKCTIAHGPLNLKLITISINWSTPQMWTIFPLFDSQGVEDIQIAIAQHHDDFRSSYYVRVTTSVDSFASSSFC